MRGLRGSNFYVVSVGQIYFCVGQFFLRGSLPGSKFFTWVQSFCVGQFFFALVNFYLRDEIFFTILQLTA